MIVGTRSSTFRLLIHIFLFLHLICGENLSSEHSKKATTSIGGQNEQQQLPSSPHQQVGDLLVAESRSSTLLVSTIDGYLTAIDARTGLDKWRFREGPLLESPVNVQRGFTFIPDPRDGQLYLVVEGRLSKLPFTIPHLVRVSPCKSSDGVFYAGNKKDVWITLNPETGERSDPFEPASPSFCPASHGQAVHIGKTEYRIQMVDMKHKERHWNATFVDYSSHLLPEDANYPLQHFTNSADGRLLTVDLASGFVLWQRDLGHVIVNMYLLKGDGMHRLPSAAIGAETFELLAQSAALNPLLHAPAQLPDRLLPTLFVGQSPRIGLYALPAFVDERTNRIAPKYLGPPLLEGPKQGEEGGTTLEPVDGQTSSTSGQNSRQTLPPDTVGPTYTTKEGDEFLILGYHETPAAIQRSDLAPVAASSTSSPAGLPLITFNHHQQKKPNAVSTNGHDATIAERILFDGIQIQQHTSSTPAHHPIEEGFLIETLGFAQRHPYQVSSLLALLIALIVVCSWLLGKQSTLLRHRTWSSDSTPLTAAGTEVDVDASRSSRGSVFTAYDPDELPLGWHRVNNSRLSYNSGVVLGRGCEGTIVYIGKFDDRPVAVKRILSENLDRGVRQQIDREVVHLRQSDSHPNVIRYFCSETDRHFHYLALELCDVTLDDFVRRALEDGEGQQYQLTRRDRLDLMKQTADGIAHLHRINIVHRDVKPKNILLLLKGRKNASSPADEQQHLAGRICVKISDFGLCKSIKLGHNSISRVSGVVGTEGWMAPELFSSDASVTYAVDVFSLGCVFYYVLTDGQHPFGEPLYRMSNIKFGRSSLNFLDQSDISHSLVEAMLRPEPKQRPAASAVAAHPLFWEQTKQLQFLMEVSDWIEKKDVRDPVMRRLELGRDRVVGNWLDRVDEVLKIDLLKQRSYMNNVRDLLRAIRNKKHHYQELSPELRLLLGPVPNEYFAYFTGKFPKLLMHAFMAMACIGQQESLFRDYFQPETLRHFYDQEWAALVRAEPKRRSASPSNWRVMKQGGVLSAPGSPQHGGNGMANVTTTTALVTTISEQKATTILLPTSFDPTIPPPMAPSHFNASSSPLQPVADPPLAMQRRAMVGDVLVEVVQQRNSMMMPTIVEPSLDGQKDSILPASLATTTMATTTTVLEVGKKIKSPKAKKAKRKKQLQQRNKAPFSLLMATTEQQQQQQSDNEEGEGEDSANANMELDEEEEKQIEEREEKAEKTEEATF